MQNFSSKEKNALEIDLKHFFLGLKKIWWKALAICLFFAVAGFFFSRSTYVPTYTSTTTFVVSNKAVGGSNTSDSLTISDISASNALANTFKYILLSDDAIHSVVQTYRLGFSIDQLKKCIAISQIPNTNILEMKVVTTDATLSRDISTGIITNYQDALNRTLKNASLEVLNAPRIAQAADRYNGVITYPLIGFLLGFIGSAVFIYLKLLFRDTLITVSDINHRLSANTLAAIPKIRSAKKKLFVTDKSNGFAFAESYKALRTKIETIAKKKGYKTFIVTSSLQNEGKTTVAVNLSIVLAGIGKKVLLIDADLRMPSVYEMLDQESSLPKNGLDRVLTGEINLETAVVNMQKLGISVLLNDHVVQNSSELLASNQMKDLIARASQQYDYVIVDSSPANAVTDSVIMTSYADAVILILRQDYAPVHLVDTVMQSLSENKAEFIGCIFNNVDNRNFDYRNYREYKKSV